METRGYARGLLRWSWLVVLLTVLAGVGAYLLVKNTKDAYTGAVNVTVPPAQAATAGANGQYVANFTEALGIQSVLDAVSRETHEDATSLSDGLSATQLGASSFIEVTYDASTPEQAQRVAQSAANAASALLARPTIDAATTTLSSAKKALTVAAAQQDAAQRALTAFSAKHGLVDPTVRYQAAQSAITQLNVSKQQAIAQGRSTTSFDSAIASAQATLDALAPLVTQYDALSHKVTQANLATEAAQSRVITATADLATAQAAPLLGKPTSSLVSRRSVMERVVAVAAGLAFVLAVALVLLVLFLRATRRAAEPGSALAVERAGSGTPAPAATDGHEASSRRRASTV